MPAVAVARIHAVSDALQEAANAAAQIAADVRPDDERGAAYANERLALLIFTINDLLAQCSALPGSPAPGRAIGLARTRRAARRRTGTAGASPGA